MDQLPTLRGRKPEPGDVIGFVIVSSNGLGGGIENRDGQVIVHATPEEAYLQLELKHAHLRQYEHEVLPALLGSIEDSTRPLLDLPPASYPSEES